MRKIEERPLDDDSNIRFQPLEAEITTPLPEQRRPVKPWERVPRGWRYATAGAALLLVLGMVLVTVLPRLATHPTPALKPHPLRATATTPAQTQPGAIPALNAVPPSDKAI